MRCVNNNSGISHILLGKRASSHFEIIISFILFVGFTLFLILSLEPTKKDLLEESILFGLKNSIFENATTNVTSVLVDTKKNDGECNNNLNKIVCYPDELESSGEKINITINPDVPCVNYVLASNEFTGLATFTIDKCRGNSDKYSIGYIEKQQLLSNISLWKMKERYYFDYAGLKDYLHVPNVVDFAIISSDNNFNMTRVVPDDAEVIAGVYRKKVLYGNGSIVNQDFIVKVW